MARYAIARDLAMVWSRLGLPESLSPLRAEANPYYGRGHHSQLTGYVPHALNNRVMADPPVHASPEQAARPSIHDRLGPGPGFNRGFTVPNSDLDQVNGVTFPVLDPSMAGYGTPTPGGPMAGMGGVAPTPPFPPAPAPVPVHLDYAAQSFADGVLNVPGQGYNPNNNQALNTLTQTLQLFMTWIDARQSTLESELELHKRSTAPPPPLVTSLPGPTRPTPQYAASTMHPAPHFAPYLAPQGGEHYSQPLPAGSYVPTAPPPAYQQSQAPPPIFSFAPQTAYQPSAGPPPASYSQTPPPALLPAILWGGSCGISWGVVPSHRPAVRSRGPQRCSDSSAKYVSYLFDSGRHGRIYPRPAL
jgi:hypothetical protein